MSEIARAEIIVSGLVQGVGFRFFVRRTVDEIGGLTGFVRNLFSGEVQAVVEGDRKNIERLFARMKRGPRSAHVDTAVIEWEKPGNGFSSFEVRI